MHTDAKIKLIKEVEVNDSTELRMIENDYIKKFRLNEFNVVNKNKAFNPYEEKKERHNKDSKKFYSNNKEEILKKQKSYNKKNADYIRTRNKRRYENDKESILKKQKKYSEEHKEHIKQYFKDNKDKFNEKFDCKCGGKFTRRNKSVHEKTQKHITYCSVVINN